MGREFEERFGDEEMIVGLCGYARTGKDEAAKALEPLGFRRFAFADALKSDLVPLLSMVGCDLKNPAHKEKARVLLVAWGATARAFQPDFWVKRLMAGMLEEAVISDVRYANEVESILDQCGIVFSVARPGYGPANDEELRSFAEIDKKYPDLPEIKNTGSLEEWHVTVSERVCELLDSREKDRKRDLRFRK